jgi:hypothetical protein
MDTQCDNMHKELSESLPFVGLAIRIGFQEVVIAESDITYGFRGKDALPD